MGFLATWDGKEEWKQIERRQFTEVSGQGGIYGAPDSVTLLWTIGWDRRSVILKLLDNENWYTYRLPKSPHTFFDHRGGWNSSELKAIGSHLRIILDFTYWNGKLVLTNDQTTLLQNPYPGRCYANFWFEQFEDLQSWGEPWTNDFIQANVASDPFLIYGFKKTVLHLMHNTTRSVDFTLEIDKTGNNQ
ncbi:unnamed protein product [Adineta ricciae]|uniref:Uncharacterized protein n=1 Tax=Adineta ricciae TaxID=249248 RepID=A0A813P2B1_ADIRI|nr:unnamed protein product [Adineta ricciae]CAF0744002.1 unnamed protein product [Adineta ricciae]